jgi:hypothetical protein
MSIVTVIIILVVLLIVSLVPHILAWFKESADPNSTLVSTITLANPAGHVAISELQIFDKAGVQLVPYKDFHFYQSTAYNAAKPTNFATAYAFDGSATSPNMVTSTADKERFVRIILDTPRELSSIKISITPGLLYSKEGTAWTAGAKLTAFNQAGTALKEWTAAALKEQTFSFA